MTDHHSIWIVILAVLLVSFTAPALSQTSGDDATIQNVTYVGDASVEPDDGASVLWREGSHRVAVTVSSESGFDGELCLSTDREDGASESELACRPVALASGSSTSVDLEYDSFPSNLTGRHAVHTTVRSADDGTVRATVSTVFTVLDEDGDADEDGLRNDREASLGTNLRDNDTDSDGIDDGVEVRTYGTDPLSADTDGDSLDDREEIRTYRTDPTATDTDGDGVQDDREISNGTSPNVADTDGDGLDDGLELNTYGTNATRADSDGDGLDDGSEVRDHETNPSRSDTDGDGLPDNLEIHTYDTDPNAIDSDGDGLQDGAEVTDYRTEPTSADTDEDGLLDGAEVNIHGTNPKKADTDGDGLDDEAEVNRFETDPLAADTDGDGVSDPDEVDRGIVSPALLRRLPVGVGVVVFLVGIGLYAYSGRLPVSIRSALPATLYDFGDRRDGDDRASKIETASRDRTGDAPAEQYRPHLDAEAGRGTAGGDVSPVETPDERPASGDNAADSEDVDFDLLPNSECVLTILDRNDGKIRQSELVEATGWSKAKVSRVLSQMEADDQIVKVSVGRGNLITKPSDVPSGAKSPFED